MINRALIAKLDMKNPAVWLATWGGCGLIARAPGTWGTLGAVPATLLATYAGGWPALLIFALATFIAGYYAVKWFEAAAGEHDSGAIVIDEVAGFAVAMLAAPLTLFGVALTFLLFRFFDILKPWPVSQFDKMPGAFGVMADDIMAGIYAAICIGGARYAGII